MVSICLSVGFERRVLDLAVRYVEIVEAGITVLHALSRSPSISDGLSLGHLVSVLPFAVEGVRLNTSASLVSSDIVASCVS